MKTVDKLLCVGIAGIAVGLALKVARKRGVIKW